MARTTTRARTNDDIATRITNRIIEALEGGTRDWHCPWATGSAIPLRACGTPYQGINALLLMLTARERGYSAPYWMTYKRAKLEGGQVRRGERGTMVVRYGTSVRPGEDGAPPSENGALPAQQPETIRRWLRAYTVFSVHQIDGLDPSYTTDPTAPSIGAEAIPRLEAFFDALPIRLEIGGTRACYIPSQDLIRMPPIAAFEDPEKFYATLAHEACHWSKGPGRLERDFGPSVFGNDAYAKEELVAELAAAILGGHLGLAPYHIEDHAAYIGSWIKALKGEKTFILKAAGYAQAASTYLLDLAADMRHDTVTAA